MSHFHRILCIVSLLLIAALSADAQTSYRGYRTGETGSIRGIIGYSDLDGNSQYWDDIFTDFTGDISDFDDFEFSMDYRFPLQHGSALLFSMGWYEGKTTQAYQDWVDASGRDISHLTSLWTFEMSGAYIYEFGEHRNSITPYLGIGAGYLWWDLEEYGDFIDFNDDDLPIITARYTASSGTFEYFFVGGIDFRISPNMSLVVQGRWVEADDELGGAFAGFGTIDLSGIHFGAGLALHF